MTQRKPSLRRNAIATAALMALSGGPLQAANVSWIGPNASFWDLVANWSTGAVPGAADDAQLGAFNTTFNSGALTIRSFNGTGTLSVTGGSLSNTLASSSTGLNLSAGTIGGAGTITISGALNWTGGLMTGTGATFANTVTLSGLNTKTLSGGRILNAANTTWSGNTGNGNNLISIASTSVFNSTGSFTDANTFNSTINGGTFNNSGTFNKQSNTTTLLSTVFNNTGTVNVNAGTMLMQTGTSTGVFNIADGAKVEVRNGTHILNNVTTSGAGLLQISTENVGADASVTINGGTLNSAFLLSGSTLRGTDHVFQGPATWTGGTINGTAAQSTTFASTLLISGALDKTLSGGRILNAGNTTWTGNTGNNNDISLGGSSTFNNTGSFTDANAFNSSITAGTFNNRGTFNKQSNTTSSIGTVFNNTGAVNVNAGTMLMNGGGTSTGVFNIANSAKLEYRNGSHVLENVTMNGAGIFQISSEGVGADASVAVNGGTLNTAFLLSGSALRGTDHVFQGPATWTGGTITGTAEQSTTFANALSISGLNRKTLSGGRSVTAGNTTWSGNTGNGNNDILISGGSVFNSNGTFTDANTFESTIDRGNGGGAFNNNGTFNKQSNTTTSIGTAFNNNGTVNVNAGTMLMTSLDASTSTGVFNIAGGAKLEYRNGSHTLNNVTTSGAGTFEISTENVGADATVSVNGGTHTTAFVLSGSTMAGGNATFQGPATWTGGTISGPATTTFDNNVVISGANTKIIVGGRTVTLNGTTTWSGNTGNQNNAIRFWNGATIDNNGTFNDTNAFASFIEHNVGGPHNFNNNGTYNKKSNTVTTVDLGVVFNNSGTLNIDAGTMRFFSGTKGPTGTVNVAAGATFQQDTASTVGNLVTAGTLVLGTQTLTVHLDYNNANFGVGNSFNRRANVNVAAGGPAQRLLAAGDANQGVTGVGISNGATANPTLTIGNVHVGDTTYTYNITNTGSTGPSLRGAIQTVGNGANIDPTRLKGSGVESSNWGPVAPGASTSRDITITVGTAGVYAPLIGQAVGIVNNFENTRGQLLTITSAAGAAAYNLAAGQLNTAVLNFGTVQVGQSVSRVLSISNIATGPAGFVEDLNARFGATSGTGSNLISGSGSIANLLAGATNASAMTVNVNTAGAGTVNGAIAVNYFSAGAVNSVSNGLGELGVGSSSFGVAGTIQAVANVINQASPLINNAVINLGNVRVGAASPTQAVSITNVATVAPQAALNATVSAAAPITASGSFDLLAPGGTNSTAIVVGMQTATAGAKAGTATVAFVSDANNVGNCAPNCQLGIGTQNVSVSGNVYNAAVGSATPTPATVANQRVGGVNVAALTVTNTAAAGAFSENLNASNVGFSGSAGFSGGNINGLLAGASNNTTMGVNVDTATSGAKTGTVTLAYQTAGAVGGVSNGLGTANVGTQVINVSGNVYQAASGLINTAPLNFGTVQVGQSVSQNLVIRNTATGAAGFVEDLNASFGVASGTNAGFISGSGTLNGILAGANSGAGNGAMTVNVNTSSAGVVNGSMVVNYFTAGAVNGVSNGLGIAAAGSQGYGVAGTIQTVANVINQASPLITNTVINLGNVRVGAASPTQAVSITNVATVAPQAALNATVSAAAPITASGSFNLLAPGATNSTAIVVGMQTATAGANSGTATVSFVSDANNVGNCAPNCQLGIGTQNVSVSGNVYRLANPTLNTPSVNLVARVGDANPGAPVSVTNTSPDAFTERLNGSFGSVASGFVGSGAIAGLGAGASSSALALSMNTASAGTFSGAASLNFVSSGAGTTGAPDAALASQQVALSGRVYTPAVGQLNTTVVDFGIVHKGDVVGARNVSVTNAAAVAAPNDVLRGSLGGAAGPFTANGSLAGVTAQATDTSSLSVALNTAAAGVFNGSAAASFSSHNAEMADLALTGANVALKAQVNNFAELALGKVGGDGALSSAANSYTLDFGTIVLGSTDRAAELGVFNIAAGPADLLNGTFTFAAGSGFSFAGFNPFADIAAGSSLGGFDIVFDSASLGTFSQTITVSSFGTNASGFEGTVFDTTLILRGTVTNVAAIPEPQTYALMIGGLLAIWATRRRQQRRLAA